MTALLTGATGFIGRYVLKRLIERGHNIVAIVRHRTDKLPHESCTVVQCDLKEVASKSDELASYKPEACIHLAWEGIPDFSFEQCEKNLIYGCDLLKVCESIGINRFVSTGSCWEYENLSGQLREGDMLSARNSFAAAKNAQRLMAEAFCKENGIGFCWLRLFYVFGPGQKESSLIPHILMEFNNGRRPEIKKPNNANDFIYVSDVARAVVQAAETMPDAPVLNVGRGEVVKVGDICQYIQRVLGVGPPPPPPKTCAPEKPLSTSTLPVASGNDVSYWADMSQTSRILEWRPEVSIWDGINEMMGYKEDEVR